MEEHFKNFTGMLGVSVTTGSAIVAWLPVVNLLVQIGAGITAIVVGLFTIRYYHRRAEELG